MILNTSSSLKRVARAVRVAGVVVGSVSGDSYFQNYFRYEICTVFFPSFVSLSRGGRPAIGVVFWRNGGSSDSWVES